MFKSAEHILVACVIELYGARVIFSPQITAAIYSIVYHFRATTFNAKRNGMVWMCGDHHHIGDECAWHFPAFEWNLLNNTICER